MHDKANLSLVPSPDEEAWTPQAERLYDRGEINADEARLRSGLPVAEHDPAPAVPEPAQEAGRQAVGASAELEEVTEEHVPQPGARRESTYTPPPARTARQKAARDQGEALKHKTPPEWQPIIRKVS